MPDLIPWTAKRVLSALYPHFAMQGYACLREVGEPSGRRIDMLAVRSARRPGLGHLERLAIEVKVTRGDFHADLRNPAKQAPWREYAHRHAFAVPAGLVHAAELPDGSGLIEVDPTGRVSWDLRAPYTDTNPVIPSWLTLTLAHRAARAEWALGWSAVPEENQ